MDKAATGLFISLPHFFFRILAQHDFPRKSPLFTPYYP